MLSWRLFTCQHCECSTTQRLFSLRKMTGCSIYFNVVSALKDNVYALQSETDLYICPGWWCNTLVQLYCSIISLIPRFNSTQPIDTGSISADPSLLLNLDGFLPCLDLSIQLQLRINVTLNRARLILKRTQCLLNWLQIMVMVFHKHNCAIIPYWSTLTRQMPGRSVCNVKYMYVGDRRYCMSITASNTLTWCKWLEICWEASSF